MTANLPANLERTLHAEAKILRYLLDRHLDDRRFLAANTQNRIVYFMDSHELKAYIKQNVKQTLPGFAFESEVNQLTQRDELNLRLKSEYVHDALLFGEQCVGLLPSHSEELDEELLFQATQVIDKTVSLLQKAHDEIDAIRGNQITGAFIEQAISSGNPEKIKLLVSFLRRAAPALMALLRGENLSAGVRARIEALVTQSTLRTLEDFPWETEFNLSTERAKALRELQPEDDQVDAWRRHLETQAPRRKNSNRANRIDADAVASIEALNTKLAEFTNNTVCARLVTRAMTLINAARGDAHKDRLQTNALRHPRLLSLPGEAAPEDTEKYIGELHVAVGTFGKQLTAEPWGEQNLTAARISFTSAFNDLERGRISFDLPSRIDDDIEPEVDEKDLKRLLHWVNHADDFEQFMLKELDECVQVFGKRTYALVHESEQKIRASVTQLDFPPRTRITPMLPGVPGPLDFTALQLRIKDPITEDLESLIADLKSSIAERYFAWALLHACRGRWDLAHIYATSVTRLAERVHVLTHEGSPHEVGPTNRVRQEAAILIAQICRLRGTPEGDTQANQAILNNLIEASHAIRGGVVDPNDPRVIHERVAQILDLFLATKTQHPEWDLTDGIALIENGLLKLREDKSADAELMSARLLALGVMYAAAMHQPKIQVPENRARIAELGLAWHIQLRELMLRLRNTVEIEQLPRRARAMEIIGFRLRDGSPIPFDLRHFARELRDQIHPSGDSSARMMTDELDRILQRLARYMRRDPVYAPIWAPYLCEEILNLLREGGERSCASFAYECLLKVAGPQQTFSIDTSHRRLLIDAERNFKASIESLQTRPSTNETRRAAFHLRMDRCFAKLLLTRIPLSADEQQREWGALLAHYEDLARDYPEASMPHFRLEVLYTLMKRKDVALPTLQKAMELLPNDPFLCTIPNHWIRSTLRRRLGLAYSNQAEKACDKAWRREAFCAVWDEFETFDAAATPPPDHFYELERVRRINNIVYSAYECTETDPAFFDNAPAGFSLQVFESLTDRLNPNGIDELTERQVLHTLGCAYRLLHKPYNVRQAGKRLLMLIPESGEDRSETVIARTMDDAYRWVQD